VTLAKWPDHLTVAVANNGSAACLYFVMAIVIGNFVFFNLFIGVVIEAFSERKHSEEFDALEALKERTKSPEQLEDLLLLWTDTRHHIIVVEVFNHWYSLLEGKRFACDLVKHTENYNPDASLALDRDLWKRSTDNNPSELKKTQELPSKSPVGQQGSWSASDNSKTKKERKMQAENQRKIEEYIARHELFGEAVFHSVDNSLAIFPINGVGSMGRFRHWCMWHTEQERFNNGILILIVVNTAFLTLERPGIDEDSLERLLMTLADLVFTLCFTVEFGMKVVAMGLLFNFCPGRKAYFQVGWNRLDGTLVIAGFLDLVIKMITGSSKLKLFRTLRVLRALRPLRTVSRVPELKLIVDTMGESLTALTYAALIMLVFLLLVSVLSTQMLAGTLGHCLGAPDVPTKKLCADRVQSGQLQAHEGWQSPNMNFDSVINSMVTMFFVAVGDGWVDIMWSAVDAVGIDKAQERDYNPAVALFFIFWFILANFTLINMFVAIIVDNYDRQSLVLALELEVAASDVDDPLNEHHDEKFNESGFELWKLAQKRKNQQLRKAEEAKANEKELNNLLTQQHAERNTTPWYLQVARSIRLELLVAAMILGNIGFMAVEHYQQSEMVTTVCKYAEIFFSSFFMVEAIFKIAALGFKEYWSLGWNRFDLIVASLSVTNLVLEYTFMSIFNPTILRALRALRLSRVLRLLKYSPALQSLLTTVSRAMPQVGNLVILLLLLYVIFGTAGVELFGELECTKETPCKGLSDQGNYKDFLQAQLILIRATTGDNVAGLLEDGMRTPPLCDDSADCKRNCCGVPIFAMVFYVLLILISKLIILNVVIAMLTAFLAEETQASLAQGIMDGLAKAEEAEKKAKSLREAGVRQRKYDMSIEEALAMAQGDISDANDLKESIHGKNKFRTGASVAPDPDVTPH